VVETAAPFLDEDLKRNFRFLVLEVIKQIGNSARYLDGETDVDIEKLSSRDDYIDHLRTLIENKCFALLRQRKRIDQSTVDFLRHTTTVTTNLERIADYAVGIARQAGRIESRNYLSEYDFNPFYDTIFESLQQVVLGYESVDTAVAVRIADGELELDRLYKERFEAIVEQLKGREGEAPNLISALLIFHYLERIGDCLQNIGEAIISAAVGERMKMRAYRELAGSLEMEAGEPRLDEISFEGVWGTRSGAQIGRVKAAELEKSGGEAIFKRGHPDKLRREREAMDRWSRIAPGMAPEVIKYQEAERDTMLVEYLEGQTLLEIVLHAQTSHVVHVIGRVQETLDRIWSETRDDTPVRPSFIGQLEKRLEDVYRVHPYFRAETQEISGVRVATLPDLLASNRYLDDELVAPFSVFGHGDFNLDNVLYNDETDSVHFIDLHRSGRMDYAQDLSVFLVSNFRVPEFRPRRRAALNRVIEVQLDFGERFANRQDDRTYQARLALGLIRSLVTSTRFDLRRTFAEELLPRGRYLLERLSTIRNGDFSTFELPRDILFYTAR